MSQIRWPVPAHSAAGLTRVSKIIGGLAPDETLVLFPEALERSRALGSPQANASVVMAALERSRAQGGPTVSTQVVIAALERSRAQGGPTITGLQLGTTSLVRARALGAQTVSPQVLPSALERTRAQGDVFSQAVVDVPVIHRATEAHQPRQRQRVSKLFSGLEPAPANTISPSALERSRALGVTSLSPMPAALVRSRAQGSPTIGLPASITLPGLTSVSPGIPLLLGSSQRQRTLGSPHLTAPTPAGLERTRVLYVPRVDPSLVTTGITQTRTLGSSTVVPGTVTTGLEHTRAISTHTVSPTLVITGLERVRIIGTMSAGDPVTGGTQLLLLRGVG